MPLKGICTFDSETGTEGGYWAFQDEKFMHLPPSANIWHCQRCGRIWDKAQQEQEPSPRFFYYDPEVMNGTGGHRGYDEPQDLPTSRDEGDFNDMWAKLSNAASLECYVDQHHEWESPEEQYPEGVWSYEGLHILRNGDYLTIFDLNDPTKIVWKGSITLHPHEPFTETAHGMWIHADQKGVDREPWARWFMEEFPAELIPIEDR